MGRPSVPPSSGVATGGAIFDDEGIKIVAVSDGVAKSLVGYSSRVAAEVAVDITGRIRGYFPFEPPGGIDWNVVVSVPVVAPQDLKSTRRVVVAMAGLDDVLPVVFCTHVGKCSFSTYPCPAPMIMMGSVRG